MATSLQLTKEHAKAAERAAEYFSLLAKCGELPITPDGLTEHARAFFKKLDAREEQCVALALAALADQPCPCSLFRPWASWDVINAWSKKETDPLKTELLNGKLCLRPSDFFAALKRHGKTP